MIRALALSLIAFLCLIAAAPAFAVEPDEMLDDPVLETRAREIGRELRCLVCQNESIEDSNADLARDLRLVVRERLLAGDSDQQVLDYVAARYGDFVLLQPPVKPATLALWFGPASILLVGGAIAFFYVRSRRTAPAISPLSADEERRLAALTGDAPRETSER
ncbi:MAG: cytochrome c-type biogenesis protein [Rhodospirillaceae bacterium]|nr:cytochrome c-type biogenesis protein [Rhodospirillaceae bacterium]